MTGLAERFVLAAKVLVDAMDLLYDAEEYPRLVNEVAKGLEQEELEEEK
jgi:hypothetical protein